MNSIYHILTIKVPCFRAGRYAYYRVICSDLYFSKDTKSRTFGNKINIRYKNIISSQRLRTMRNMADLVRILDESR